MQSRVIGILGNDGLVSPDGEVISHRADPRAVAVRQERTKEPPRQVIQMDPVDEVAGLLARVIHIAQTLNETDQRRVRDLTHAASSALSASTCLPRDDQRRFEQALRNVRN